MTQAPKVKPLVWVDFHGRGAKASAWLQANYMFSRWSNGSFELSASYPGYSSVIDGVEMFYPTFEAALIEAEKALEPISDIARDRVAGSQEWNDSHDVNVWVSIGALRKASAALARIRAITGGGDE